MKIKKKWIIIVGVVLALLILGGGLFWFFRDKGGAEGSEQSTVYVDSIADICGLGSGNGLTDRFSGVVEPQKTLKIQLPSDKKVEEILVKEGDEVKTGAKLFTYSTEEMEENLAQAEIDLDRLANEIDQTTAQIAALKKEKGESSSDLQLSYTTQINTAENDIKKKEYEQKSKKVEIEKLKNSIANATVTSEMDGVVKAINPADSESSSVNGEAEAFMTILATGDFRVKALVNEQNMSAIIEGDPVIIHSRVDENVWKGTLTSVDMENPEKNNSNMYVSNADGSSMDSSSNYPFYVELETADGLMLGQHVYIEMDNGQDEKKEGIWLDSYYIIQEGEKAYVWAANAKDKIEKREVTLGEFDENLQQYQITDGLTEEDYIAFPDETIKAGDKAEKNVDQASDLAIPEGNTGIENSIPDLDGNNEIGGMMDEGYDDSGEDYDSGEDENYDDSDEGYDDSGEGGGMGDAGAVIPGMGMEEIE